MRNYVMIKGEQKWNKNYGYWKQNWRLYEVKKGVLVFIDETTIATASWGGPEYTAINSLRDKHPNSRILKNCDDYGYDYFYGKHANLQIISY